MQQTQGGWPLNPDRCFDPDPAQRGLARTLYEGVQNLPLVCPHGHVPPELLADPNATLGNPAELLIVPDHYVFRMLYSQGVPLESLGVARRDGGTVETDGRRIWQTFAEQFHLFRGTPTGLWLHAELVGLFGVTEKLTGASAGRIYDQLVAKLAERGFSPVPCSLASISKPSAPPTPRRTRWNITAPCARRGTRISAPPFARTAWSISTPRLAGEHQSPFRCLRRGRDRLPLVYSRP